MKELQHRPGVRTPVRPADNRTAPISRSEQLEASTADQYRGPSYAQLNRRPQIQPPQKANTWRKVATGTALALSALGVVGGLVGNAAPVVAQTMVATEARTEATRFQSANQNSDLNLAQVETIEALFKIEGRHQNRHFEVRRATEAVAAATDFSAAKQQLVVSIAEKTVKPAWYAKDWDAGNRLIETVIEAPEPTQQQLALATAFLSATDLRETEELVETALQAPHLDDNRFALLIGMGNSTSESIWHPHTLVSHILSKGDGLSDVRLELGLRTLEDISGFSWRAGDALVTVLEAPEITKGPQTEAMHAVLDRAFRPPASDGDAWYHANDVFRLLATKPDLTAEEAATVRDLIEPGGAEALEAVSNYLDGDFIKKAETAIDLAELAEADVEVSLAGAKYRTPYTEILARNQAKPRYYEFALDDSSTSADLQAAKRNPDFNEHSLRLIELARVQRYNHEDLAVAVAGHPGLRESQADAYRHLVSVGSGADLTYTRGSAVSNAILGNPDFKEENVRLLRTLLTKRLSSVSDSEFEAIKAALSAPSLTEAQTDDALNIYQNWWFLPGSLGRFQRALQPSS